MISDYILKMPSTVYGGEHALENIVTIIGNNYSKTAVFTDRGILAAGILDKPLALLRESGTELFIIDEIPSEPTCGQAQKIIDLFKESRSDFIVAIGGGSVMDLAKLSSIADEITVEQLLENPLAGKKKTKTLMIPTTAGTGSEATANAIVAVPEKELKIGIVNEEMLADYVILDGRMTASLPEHIAAATGIDALSHAIECLTSNKANPFSDLFAIESIKLIFNNIEKACKDKRALREKSNMLLAAFYGGVAIASSGTTAVHALSYPLGGKYHIPHGVSNAIMLMPVMRFNKPACLPELSRVYDALKGGEGKTEDDKADWIIDKMGQLIRNLNIPSDLKDYNIGKEDLEALVEAGMEVQRLLVNNKRVVTAEDARNLYLEIM